MIGSAVAFGCAQIIGADGDRELSPYANGDGPVDPLDDGDVPKAGDPNACPPGEKRCNGACVPKSVEYGCGAAECTPCSLPNVDKVVCKDDECVAATCQPGFGACGEATEGCQADLTSPATCTSCLLACNVDAGQVCSPAGCGSDCGGLTSCSGACVDLNASPSHCGSCGKACAGAANGDGACEGGACVVKCRQGFAHCDGNPAGPCTALQVFYRDNDGDGYGVTSDTKLACNQAAAGAGWASLAGDCHDGNQDVRPGQAGYFGAPYTTPAGAPSYDYDCNGVEEEEAGTTHFVSCKSCANEGFTKAFSDRLGAGVNDFCGSTNYSYCEADLGTSGGLDPRSVQPLVLPLRCFPNSYSAEANRCH